MENVTKKSTKEIIFKQLRSMLTNHCDRPKYVLNVFLNDSMNHAIGNDKFDIYANEPISKIEEKVTKMREKGGYTTLLLHEIKEIAEKEYTLVLSI